ncbi:alpha/beta hydrolase [Evansella sp. LMS18]|uniref:alpha/beta hydrolase n=1 Tax=Evansella sp. LMS18 TaxID=2924033 RepID=UPI0020D162A1|nr:alpha/beta hydrolase [Evansella sp. LMS18]UTR11464.1 alpha/beta hydrolase [Evansella sp. LMS18]
MWKYEAKDAKAVFVIVHGAGEYHVRYNWVVEQLTKLQYHVVLGDLPGQGTTTGPSGHINSFNDYIVNVAKWLSEAKQYELPVILLAHSMGGLISIHTLMKMNEKDLPDAVILSSPCLGLANDPPVSKKLMASILNIAAPRFRFPSGLAPGSGTRSEEMRKRDVADPLLVKKVSARWYTELVKAMKQAQERTDAFPDIPVLVSQGGTDLIVNKERGRAWFDKLPVSNKYYREWEGLYHEVLNEPEQDRVFAHMLGFVTLNISC